MPLAPVIIFTYNRLGTLQQTVAALMKNELSDETDLFVFSDGPKNYSDRETIYMVRDYVRTINGFKSITLFESDINKGLGTSIIDGVSRVIKTHGKVIVLEDDLVSSSNFLVFMNAALDFYDKNSRIFSIAGFTFPMHHLEADSIYFTMRASSWGWATWQDRWSEVDWLSKNYSFFRSNSSERRRFRKMGSDMTKMLDLQMRGKLDSWAIRWCFHQFLRNKYTVFPAVSKIMNVGSAQGATNTLDYVGRFDTHLDNSGNGRFRFTHKIDMPPKIIRQFTAHFSIYTRLKYKILNAIRRG